MAKQKSIETFPDEQFIQDAIKDGRCSIQELSMKAVGEPDTAYQSRELPLDMNHVRLLEGIYRDQGQLAPVVYFSALERGRPRYILGDGFHRYRVMKNVKAASIRAYVVECSPESVEHEARLFSAMCNRRLCLQRKPEDIRKAVWTLLSDPECYSWADTLLARHCGCHDHTVRNVRRLFEAKNNVAPPEFIKVKQQGHELMVPALRRSKHNKACREPDSHVDCPPKTDRPASAGYCSALREIGAIPEVAQVRIDPDHAARTLIGKFSRPQLEALVRLLADHLGLSVVARNKTDGSGRITRCDASGVLWPRA